MSMPRREETTDGESLSFTVVVRDDSGQVTSAGKLHSQVTSAIEASGRARR